MPGMPSEIVHNSSAASPESEQKLTQLPWSLGNGDYFLPCSQGNSNYFLNCSLGNVDYSLPRSPGNVDLFLLCSLGNVDSFLFTYYFGKCQITFFYRKGHVVNKILGV